MRKYKIILLLFCFLLPVLLPVCAFSEGEGWRTIDGKYCKLYLYTDVNKERIYKRVGSSSGDFILGGLFSSPVPYSDQALVKAFDNICVKAQNILDMHPEDIKIDIKIYKNQRQLNDTLAMIGGNPNHEGELISYYVHQHRAIYTSEQSISKEIIAHEFGHVVSEYYFKEKIPYQIQELMAQEVELHIND